MLIDLGGRTVLDRSIETARSVSEGVVLVWRDATWSGAPVDAVVPAGVERSDSVRAGLHAVPEDAGVILVHDGARPLASPAIFESVLAALSANAVDAVIPALPVSDTIKMVEGNQVTATLDRGRLRAAQTPQAFRAEALRQAHATGTDATDDAALIEQSGGSVIWVEGEARNRKLTTDLDYQLLMGWAAAQ